MPDYDYWGYWEERYRGGGNSGVGSQGAAADWKARRVNAWWRGDVLDIGCGDGMQAELYDIWSYTGIDPSPAAIKIASRLTTSDWQFFVLTSHNHWYPRETHMSIDVMYHLIDDEDYLAHMELLFSATKRVIVYASDFDSDPEDYAPHVRHRNWTVNVPKGWGQMRFEAGPWSPSDFYVYNRT